MLTCTHGDDGVHPTRLVEMVDFFPTVVDLAGLPPLPTCQGVDQPPTVECLQGLSYAAEFKETHAVDPSKDEPPVTKPADVLSNGNGKQYAFSQWPQPQGGPSLGVPYYRMGYTVRAATGFRLTEYVPYSVRNYTGVWSPFAAPSSTAPDVNPTPTTVLTPANDLELYDYNVDRYETANQAYNATYRQTVLLLKQVLRGQFNSNSQVHP